MKCRILHSVPKILCHLMLLLVEFSDLLSSDMVLVTLNIGVHGTAYDLASLREGVVVGRWNDHITFLEDRVMCVLLLNLVETGT